MGSDQSDTRGFLVGGRYRNRLQEYEVLDIAGNKLRVVYDNGVEDTLDAETQARIVRNIALETATLEPYTGAGALSRNRRYFQSLGFLASHVTMMEAIVPPRAQAGFVQTYRGIAGSRPQDGESGYYVHHQQVDKWGNELRITFGASDAELQSLDFGPNVEPVMNPARTGVSWRINNNAFWWTLLRLGFKMGSHQILDEIRERIPQVYRRDFDRGASTG